MNRDQSTADIPNLALLTRAYCPVWCGHRETAGTPTTGHDTSTHDGTTVIVHRGHVVHPDLPQSAISLMREVRYDSDGTLVDRATSVLVPETLLTTQDQLAALADSLAALAGTSSDGQAER